ncbi:MAG: PA2779 family protein [Acidiferrobacterales bacterium]
MECLRRVARPVSHFVILCLLGVGAYVPASHAEIISTDAIVQAEQAEQERDRVRNLLARNDVKAYLTARGANPAEVQARVDSLTDDEIQALASHLDQLPAGGGFLELAVIVFLVLLITDILGLTDIFPFVKK